MSCHCTSKPSPTPAATSCCPAPDGRWLVRVAAPPQDGQANAELLAFLAAVVGGARRSAELLSGHAAPFKKVAISGLSGEAGAAILARHHA